MIFGDKSKKKKLIKIDFKKVNEIEKSIQQLYSSLNFSLTLKFILKLFMYIMTWWPDDHYTSKSFLNKKYLFLQKKMR